LQADALAGTALGFKLVAQGKVALIEVTQAAMRSDKPGALLPCAIRFAGDFLLAFPVFDGVREVALEHFGQIMGAEEFVVIGQANEGGGGVLYGHDDCPV